MKNKQFLVVILTLIISAGSTIYAQDGSTVERAYDSRCQCWILIPRNAGQRQVQQVQQKRKYSQNQVQGGIGYNGYPYGSYTKIWGSESYESIVVTEAYPIYGNGYQVQTNIYPPTSSYRWSNGIRILIPLSERGRQNRRGW